LELKDTGTEIGALIYSPDNHLIAFLKDFVNRGPHPFQVRGDQIFWIRHGSTVSPSESADVWVMQLSSKKESKILGDKVVDFLISPDSTRMMVLAEGGLSLLDLTSGAKKIVDPSTEPQLLLLQAWSRDGKRFWYAPQEPGGSNEIRLYESGKCRSFSYTQGTGNALQPDHGWITESDAPNCMDLDCANGFRRSGTVTRLWVHDLFTDVKIEVAHAKAAWYRSSWTANADLVYTIDGRNTKISEKEIIEQLAHGRKT
jgi:hypothetical protein